MSELKQKIGILTAEKLLDSIWQMGAFVRLVVSRFVEDQGLPNAASLTFTSLLSLVPLMTVVLALFSAFPISDQVIAQLQGFVFDNFLPSSGEVVQNYLNQFSQKASTMTGAGFVFLFIVALMMMGSIDRSLNVIWHVRRKRHLLGKFMVYWSILTLGPLLIGGSMIATSYVVSIPLFTDAADTLGIGQRLFSFAPIVASVAAFSLLYLLVPNRRVPFWHAVAGGVLAAGLFELAKRGFAFYITSFPTYEAIYGALAVIPIFLIWIYLSWAITLLGAEFSYCIGLFRENRGDYRIPGGTLLLSYRLLGYLWQQQHRGLSTPVKQLLVHLHGTSEEQLERQLEQLQQAHLVLRTDNEEWALAKDLSEVTLLELYQVQPGALPDPDRINGAGYTIDRALLDHLQKVNSAFEPIMSSTLESLFHPEES